MNAVSLIVSEDGFFRPSINYDLCCSCGRCATICPAINKPPAGTILSCYAARSNSAFIRLNSSSGGVFYELATQVLSEGGIVFGCVLDVERRIAMHVSASSVDELLAMRGSKYLQSDMGDCFKRINNELSNRRSVLFSGTPCQVAGLKRYLGQEYEELLCVEVVCHGVGSPLVFKRYIDEFNEEVESIKFRDKLSSQGSDFSIRFSDGGEYRHRVYSKGYDYAYNTGLVHNASCGDCQMRGVNSYADLTIGDFWGVESVVPEWARVGGVSVVVVHTEKGDRNLRSPGIAIREVTFDEATRENHSILEPFAVAANVRAEFHDLIGRMTITDAVKVFQQKHTQPAVVVAAKSLRTTVGNVLRYFGLRRRNFVLPDRTVGIYTISRNFLLSNYGSFFQHYALREVLKRLGYVPFRVERHGLLLELFDWLLPLRIARTRIRAYFRNEHAKIYGVGRNFYRRRLSFLWDFHNLISSVGEWQKHAAYYIAGGDCIWTQANPRAFLMDMSDASVKLSYGVSATWAESSANDEWRLLIAEASKRYAGVGVREELGKETCNKIAGYDVACRVLDPVLLLMRQDYNRIAAFPDVSFGSTAFAYLVNIRDKDKFNIRGFRRLATELSCDLKVLGIQGVQQILDNDVGVEFSPRKFLGAIRDCRYFITNSFHGITFALTFEKPFVFVRQDDAGDVRQLSLLEMVGLSDRVVKMSEIDDVGIALLAKDIDWTRVRSVLESERIRSIDWLGQKLECGCVSNVRA